LTHTQFRLGRAEVHLNFAYWELRMVWLSCKVVRVILSFSHFLGDIGGLISISGCWEHRIAVTAA